MRISGPPPIELNSTATAMDGLSSILDSVRALSARGARRKGGRLTVGARTPSSQASKSSPKAPLRGHTKPYLYRTETDPKFVPFRGPRGPQGRPANREARKHEKDLLKLKAQRQGLQARAIKAKNQGDPCPPHMIPLSRREAVKLEKFAKPGQMVNTGKGHRYATLDVLVAAGVVSWNTDHFLKLERSGNWERINLILDMEHDALDRAVQDRLPSASHDLKPGEGWVFVGDHKIKITDVSVTPEP